MNRSLPRSAVQALGPCLAAALLSGALGCVPEELFPSATSESSAGIALDPAPGAPLAPMGAPAAVPSSGANGMWDKAQVEQYVTQQLRLAELSLIWEGGGNYSGTGRDAEGAVYTLVVEQEPGGFACNFTTNTGGHGRFAFGTLVKLEETKESPPSGSQ